MKSKSLTILALALPVIGFAVLWATPRWMAVRIMHRSPEKTSHLKLIADPAIQIRHSDNRNTSTINLGYAEFALPSDIDINITSRGSFHTTVVLSSPTMTFGFLRPRATDVTDTIDAFVKLDKKANSVDALLLSAKVPFLPAKKIFMMSNAEVITYISKLTLKTTVCPTAERIIPYKTLNSFGAICIKDEGSRGVIELSSPNREITQSIAFKMPSSSIEDLPPDLTYFLGSFKFSVDSCPSKEQIAKMIAQSGISPWIQTSNESHTATQSPTTPAKL